MKDRAISRGSGGSRFLALRAALAFSALALAALASSESQRRSVYTTSDEPLHLQAAREMRFGPGVVSNFEHPVLMKVLAAAGLEASPPALLVEETREGRRGFVPLLAGIVVLSALWASTKVGLLGGAAVGALLLADPTLRVHTVLVQSDGLLVLFLLAAGLLLEKAARSTPAVRLRWIAACGVAYGLAIASKHSALPFFAGFLVVAAMRLGFVSRRAARPASSRKKKNVARQPVPRARTWPSIALLAAVALVTAGLVQQAALLGTPKPVLLEAVHKQFGGFLDALPEQQTAMEWVERLPRGLGAYAAGLLYVKASSGEGVRFNYFMGEVSGKGFLFYFPVALLVKLPTAVVAGLVAGAAALFLGLRSASAASRRRLLRVAAGRAFVPGALAVGYLTAAMLARVNIGVRHVLPVIPLGTIAVVALLRPLVRPRALRAGLLAVVVLGAVWEGGARWGREIPFGNLLVGGPGPGLRRVLSDSNVEWGEAQGRLFDRVRAGGLGRAGLLTIFVNTDESQAVGLTDLGPGFEPGTVDSAFVSVFLHDVGLAVEKSTEDYSKTRWLKSWLPQRLHAIEDNASSVELFCDEYLLYRLGPPAKPPSTAPPGPRPPGPPGPAR